MPMYYILETASIMLLPRGCWKIKYNVNELIWFEEEKIMKLMKGYQGYDLYAHPQASSQNQSPNSVPSADFFFTLFITLYTFFFYVLPRYGSSHEVFWAIVSNETALHRQYCSNMWSVPFKRGCLVHVWRYEYRPTLRWQQSTLMSYR